MALLNVKRHQAKAAFNRFFLKTRPLFEYYMKSLLAAFGPSRNKADWASSFFKAPLVDLVEADARFNGILTPEPELGAEKVGISEQFLANAQIYDSKYKHSVHMIDILGRAFEAVGFSAKASSDILDLGTGSGKNSLLPMMELFDNARFVATDLSPDLLAILRQFAVKEKLTHRIACVCTDAMNSFFRPRSFDVVVGVAILHHLIDLSAALRAAYSALRPGGVAVFYDPFEGFGLLGIAFKTILTRAEREHLFLEPEVANFLQAMIVDFDARRGTDKSAERFKYMDDKWLFTRTYFEDAARSLGFSSLKILARINHENTFREYVADLLRLDIERTPEALPDWAWETVGMLDQSLSAEMKADLVMEGAIVLRK